MLRNISLTAGGQSSLSKQGSRSQIFCFMDHSSPSGFVQTISLENEWNHCSNHLFVCMCVRFLYRVLNVTLERWKEVIMASNKLDLESLGKGSNNYYKNI